MMNHLETLLNDCRSVEEKTTIPALAPLDGNEQLDDNVDGNDGDNDCDDDDSVDCDSD